MKFAIAIIVIAAAVHTFAFSFGFLISKCINKLNDAISSLNENTNRKYVLSAKKTMNQYVFDYSYKN